jgi:hypothetical protein
MTTSSLPATPEKAPKNISTPSFDSTSILTLPKDGGSLDENGCRTYPVRWLILFLFVLYSTSNAFQWIQYAIINDIIVKYYGVGAGWVDWTSMIYMCVYIPLIFPATYLLQKKVCQWQSPLPS